MKGKSNSSAKTTWIATVNYTIFVYKYEICDSKIIYDDGCTEEYKSLRTPSPSMITTPATTGIQSSDIQHLEQNTKANSECVRETEPSQGQRNVQGAEIKLHVADVEMMNKEQEG